MNRSAICGSKAALCDEVAPYDELRHILRHPRCTICGCVPEGSKAMRALDRVWHHQRSIEAEVAAPAVYYHHARTDLGDQCIVSVVRLGVGRAAPPEEARFTTIIKEIALQPSFAWLAFAYQPARPFVDIGARANAGSRRIEDLC
jgi:hypothetical protein